jgi:hypothetical protein
MHLSDRQADQRDHAAADRDRAAERRDRVEDALDREGDELDRRDLVALFDEATSKLDRAAVDGALCKVDWQAQRRGRGVVTAMDNIHGARDGLERAKGQQRPAVEVQRREREESVARHTYLQLVEV